MSQSLVLNHAARVLASVSPELRADAALRRHLSHRSRFLSSEKSEIARAVFTYFRWLRWLDNRASVQTQIAEALALQQRFDKNPAVVKDQALAALAVPSWVKDVMDVPAAWLRQLQKEPALWLRARPGTAAALAAKLGDCSPPAAAAFPVSSFEFGVSSSAQPQTPNAKLQTPQPKTQTPNPKPQTRNRSADALRYTGARDLFLTPEFQAGLFEIQDLASQLTGLAAAPQPGETWWDACAGEGGKTLHLADLMQNQGLIWASDRSTRRLDSLKRRAGRAKLFNYRAALWDGSAKLPTKTKFDGILLDAPCSGLGTWQRNPHARWTTSPGDVRELAVIQRRLLETVTGSLKPGGRLIYSVCTLTRAETTGVADVFTSAHPGLEPLFVLGRPPQLTLWPHELNANGMFIAAWRRKP